MSGRVPPAGVLLPPRAAAGRSTSSRKRSICPMRGRLEDHRLITGTGRFVGDLRFEGMAHAWLVRSPHAHARIERVDTRAAAAMPGVIAVFTATDLAEAGIPDLPGGAGVTRPDGSPSPKTDRPLLARERVRYVGEPVAMIVAESEHAARMALESVEVDYTPLAAVSPSIEALGAAAPIWHEAPDTIACVCRVGDSRCARARRAPHQGPYGDHARDRGDHRATRRPRPPWGRWPARALYERPEPLSAAQPPRAGDLPP